MSKLSMGFYLMAVKGYLKWMPDKMFLKTQYLLSMRKRLNLKNPRTFNEKLQWLKLYDRNPEYSVLVDKYEVKKYVSEKIGEQYVIPTLGIWDNFDDIDFDLLPDRFVLKCTHDSGSVVICKDKANFDIDAARRIINFHMKLNYYDGHREWPYKNVKPRIIAEKYLDFGEKGIIDYKFYCFNGIEKLLYVSQGLENHATANISFLNLDWTFAPFVRLDFKPFDTLPEKPICYEKMREIARKLSAGKSFVRVDLYALNGEVCFSELTFSPTGGYLPLEPAEWDEKLGEMLKLDL